MPDSYYGRVIDQEKLEGAGRDINALRQLLVQMDRRIDKQAAVLKAVFDLVATKLGITERDLLEEVARIIRAKTSEENRTCGKCGRSLGDKKTKCLYCGEERKGTSAFDHL